jgi:hypothetical protein
MNLKVHGSKLIIMMLEKVMEEINSVFSETLNSEP